MSNDVQKIEWNPLTKLFNFLLRGGGSKDVPDSEEGDFTPGVFDASSGGNEAAYSAREGKFKRFGKLVTFQLAVDISSVAGMTGGNTVFVRGLPFTNRAVPANYPMGLSVYSNGVVLANGINAYVPASANWVILSTMNSGAGPTDISVTNLGTGWFTVAGFYYID